MQTKNVNVCQVPLNNSVVSETGPVSETPPQSPAPPLPPRSSADVEAAGYGQPYKPVPPPKPLPAEGCYSPPPPYRMPPYPLYGETVAIPGSAPEAAMPTPSALHTHSSKFPIEREVILSSADKNSKIPILQEYKKRPKQGSAAIAPEGPCRTVAWTEDKRQHMQQQMYGGVSSSDLMVARSLQNITTAHSNMGKDDSVHQIYKAQPLQTVGESSRAKEYRSQYHNPYMYNGHHAGISGGVSTGAVPRTMPTSGSQSRRPAQLPLTLYPPSTTTHNQSEAANRREHASERQRTQQLQVSEDTEERQGVHKNGEIDYVSGKEKDLDVGKDMSSEKANKAFPTRTYHTIKDMISSKFGNTKGTKDLTHTSATEQDEKIPENLNNTPTHGKKILSQSKEELTKDNSEVPQSQQRNLGCQPQMLGPSNNYSSEIGANYNQQNVRQEADSQCYQQQRHNKPVNYMSQPQAVLEQAGVYMVMRQNNAYQQYSQQTEAEENKNRGRTENSGYSVTNANTKMSLQHRRGSQPQLDNAEEEDDDEGGFNAVSASKIMTTTSLNPGGTAVSSGQSSDYEKATQRSTGQSSSNAGDSGRGSTVYSSGRQLSVRGGLLGVDTSECFGKEKLDTSTESSESPRVGYSHSHTGPSAHGPSNEPEWVDVVESELRQILDPKLHGLGNTVSGGGGANSTLSESISSLTPPLPPLSPGGSPTPMPRSYKHGNSLPYGSKLMDYDGCKSSSHHQQNKTRTRLIGSSKGDSAGFDKHRHQSRSYHQNPSSTRKHENKNKQLNLSFGLDTTDMTSTTTGGLDSVLDGHTENNSSDDDLSTTIDATDVQAIRRQLEGLESMYSEVLKLLGVKKQGGNRYQPSDPRISRRRVYGSLSSLPSSASSRPPATRPSDRRRHDDNRKKVRDLKGINKRFQRLESHVVTLARSVAHLSSEMRTQHLMIQEMENIRGEISALRSQTLGPHQQRSQSVPRSLNATLAMGGTNDAGLSNPSRVHKLTKFFGDEPPLLRLFLRRLGYEKYANIFENEKVGMVELPYLTEDRLQRMGVPLGPRLRILQEAQSSFLVHSAPTLQATSGNNRPDKIYVV